MLHLCRKANRDEIVTLAAKLLKAKCKQIHLRIVFGSTVGQNLWYANEAGVLDSLRTEEGYMAFYNKRFRGK